MDCNGQAALEYLLLVGGTVLLAAIVIVIMSTIGLGSIYGQSKGRYEAEYNSLYHSQN